MIKLLFSFVFLFGYSAEVSAFYKLMERLKGKYFKLWAFLCFCFLKVNFFIINKVYLCISFLLKLVIINVDLSWFRLILLITVLVISNYKYKL